MSKKIDLPDTIKAGDEILVWDFCNAKWLEGIYVGQWKDYVYVVNVNGHSSFMELALPYKKAKMPEPDWNKIPRDTKVTFWDNGEDKKHKGFLVTVVDGIPYCREKHHYEEFNIEHGSANPWLIPFDHVELGWSDDNE